MGAVAEQKREEVGVVGSVKKEYYCSTGYPLGMQKHHVNIFRLGMVHFLGIQGAFLILTGCYKVFIPCVLFAILSGIGITVGCHRYWSHRTFKATLPLQIFLAILQAMAAQHSIFKWCRDHRLHHKYTETDADPHDARRGFYFSHMGWLFQKQHPAVAEKEDSLDLSDLDNDPVVRFQSKYYNILSPLFNYFIPVAILHYTEPQLSLYQLTCVNCAWYVITLHGTWLVNSAAHMYGYRPYDTGIYATDNPLVSLIAMGEGYHNYHHIFPWDYKTAELGAYGTNLSALFIDILSFMGFAYDLKTVPHDVVMQRVKRTGDLQVHQEASHEVKNFFNFDNVFNNVREEDSDKLPPWGWGDEDIPQEHLQITQRISRTTKKA